MRGIDICRKCDGFEYCLYMLREKPDRGFSFYCKHDDKASE